MDINRIFQELSTAKPAEESWRRRWKAICESLTCIGCDQRSIVLASNTDEMSRLIDSIEQEKNVVQEGVDKLLTVC